MTEINLIAICQSDKDAEYLRLGFCKENHYTCLQDGIELKLTIPEEDLWFAKEQFIRRYKCDLYNEDTKEELVYV